MTQTLASFSFITFQGMVEQSRAAIFKNENGMSIDRMVMIPFGL